MKEPIEVLVLEKHLIKFYNEADYKFGSSENSNSYDKIFLNGNENVLTSLIGIKLFEKDILISSCLIGSEGGGTGINGNTTLISYGGIVVCCSNTVFKLTIPDLNLEWKTKADSATCFGIDYLDDDYMVHGELDITRLDKNGKIVWQQGGQDIFTTKEGVNDFIIKDKEIIAFDWSYNKYVFDFNGEVKSIEKIEPEKSGSKNGFEKINRKWWQIWK